MLLYLFTPWTAINLVDFYWVRKGHYSVREIFNPHGMYGRWNWRGLLAYGVGFAAMIPFFSAGLYVGPVAAALGGADIAMLVGLPVSTRRLSVGLPFARSRGRPAPRGGGGRGPGCRGPVGLPGKSPSAPFAWERRSYWTAGLQGWDLAGRA